MIEQVVFKDMIKTDYGRGIGLTGFGIQSNDLLSIGSTFNVYQQEPNAIPSGPSGGSVGPMEHVNSARMPKTSEDETYTTLQILAERWAMQNGFNPDQLTEFGHLMSMVSSTYIPRNKLKSLHEIDSGSFGKIFATSYDGAPVAVKQISNKGAECTIKSKMRELLLELRILVRIRHPNIVTFWGTATEFPTSDNPTVQPYIGLVFELCENGSLHHALFEKKNAPFKIAQKIKIAHQVALGLAYLHGKRIIHRDINTRNILLSNDLCAKIADFGCARVLAHNCKSLKTTTISGSPAYMAPEQLQGQELTEAVDNWALAVVLWEIMMDKKPWEGRFSDFKYLKAAVVNGEKLHLPADPRPYPPCYLNVIKLGMQYKASDRPSSSFMEGELHNALRMVTSGR